MSDPPIPVGFRTLIDLDESEHLESHWLMSGNGQATFPSPSGEPFSVLPAEYGRPLDSHHAPRRR